MQRLAFVFVSLLIVFLLDSYSKTVNASTNNRKVEAITRQINACPAWSELRQGDKKNKEEILKCLRRISKNETPIIRKSITQVNNEHLRDVAFDSRLFLINRYIFNTSMTTFERKLFGGWAGVPLENGKIDWLWPFALNQQGKLQLIGEFDGYYGETYAVIKEFDYFLEKFGRRKK